MDTETNNIEPKKDANRSSLGSVAAFIWDLVKILVVALAIIIPFRTFVAEPFVVSGSSMVPNFHYKDYLIIDRISYQFHQPKRGDVIVLKYPKDTFQYYIKIISGCPVDQISCQQGKVDVLTKGTQQLEVLKEDYLPSNAPTTNCKHLTTMGSEEYFVLGDNRNNANDSHTGWTVPRQDIIGKAWLSVWPPGKWGLAAHYPLKEQINSPTNNR